MKRLVLNVMMILIANSTINLQAQNEWIDFGNNGESGQLPDIDMFSSTNFNIDFYGVNRYQTSENDTIYDVLLLPGNFGKTIDIGFPQLPVLTYYIEVTIDTPIITVNSKDTALIHDFYLLPAQESEIMNEFDTTDQFNKSDSIYSLNQFYPESNIIINFPSICRNHKIATVVVYPLQFNPVTRQLKVIKNIDFTIEGSGTVESDIDNLVFDNFLKGLVINYENNSTPDKIIDLLILTPDIFESDLLQFKEWKEKLGFRTKVVTRNEVETYPPFGYQWIADPIPDDIFIGIDGYINNAYKNWGNEAPEFILLIGETDDQTTDMPTHYWYSTYPIASDMFYTTMDLNPPPGVDWIIDFPDIFIGRISIDDASELNNVLSKIINYSFFPNSNQLDYYSNIMLATQFEIMDEPGTYQEERTEDGYYTWTTERIYEHFESEYSSEYNLHRIYISESVDPIWYKNGSYVNPEIIFYGEDSGPLQEDAVPDLIDLINQGCFFINHRDHGMSANNYMSITDSWERWGKPAFTENDIPSLSNEGLLPVMFSINCQTGWFDGGTDDPFPNNYDCFGEQLLSVADKGIVGFIGATRTSYSGLNDELDIGLIDAIWPDFDIFGTGPQIPNYFLGSILDHGKMYMYEKYICTNGGNYGYQLTIGKKRRSFMQYHVLGDPTLEIWTGVPQPLYAYVDFDENSVTVYDENDQIIPEAKVVFQYGPEETEDYVVKMTDINGKVYSNLLNNYDVEVSALKHNYIPWYTTIISETQQWPADEDVRGNIIVTNNSKLTFPADTEIPKYARIVVTEGATLEVKPNMQVDFNNHYCDILSFGNFTIGPGATINMSGSGTIPAKVHLLNEELNYSYSNVSFSKCEITGIPNNLSISNNSSFEYGGIQIEKANVSVSGTGFTNARFNARLARDKSGYVHITGNCSFTSVAYAISIGYYPDFNIDNCTIVNCDDAISLYNCGSGTQLQKISNSTISQNTGTGILVYYTSVDILDNIIENNGFGIKCFNKSKVHIEGDDVNVTQEIKNNDSFEVYASAGAFPHFFSFNLVMDDYNLPGDPMVKYSGAESALDVRKNCWGTDYNLENDLDPYASYIWDPVWECMSGSGSGMGSDAQTAFFAAMDKVESEDYAGAKTGFQEIVVQYPTTKYAQASLKELFSLEAFLDNDYSVLKSYYNSEPNITGNTDLEKLADFLINFCEIKLENYPTAIAWFENIIQNPESMEDSIFAIIDLGYTYFIMENGGLKSAYAGSMTEHIPQSVGQFEEKRDYLLSLLPGDNLSESLQESLSMLKSGELMQNIPNPFTGNTEIYYKLDKEAEIEISVFNNSGKLIKTILKGNGIQGINKVDFNGTGLPSGIYFCSLKVNGQVTDSKKMTILN